MASGRKVTIYIGVTSDVIKRVWEHKNDLVPSFTSRYKIHDLVWYEAHQTLASAITRESALKNWKRKWKLELIETTNPEWRDLYSDVL